MIILIPIPKFLFDVKTDSKALLVISYIPIIGIFIVLSIGLLPLLPFIVPTIIFREDLVDNRVFILLSGLFITIWNLFLENIRKIRPSLPLIGSNCKITVLSLPLWIYGIACMATAFANNILSVLLILSLILFLYLYFDAMRENILLGLGLLIIFFGVAFFLIFY